MNIDETIKLMERIKDHYQDFIIDDTKIEEWHNFLKDYSYQDVSKKFEEHLRSEQYGHLIPKVAFLVKYLTKQKDKGKIENYVILCQLCGARIRMSDYDEHYKRCSSVNYLDNQYYKYTTKHLNRQALYKMDEESFRKKYREMLVLVRDNTKNDDERFRITAILENKTDLLQTALFRGET